ncbi:MAG: lysylphosphatidylglycerol synthase transmembrane domain-containing protein [Caldisericia bacterium]|nr:lysylphosphatidylglycerol synthase transmembrane domain-containing protein [Caldisericia bacterium]MDD4613981.1 lysylphosphatidylglycerol synthase transmembrane domain-containing protein [Caldisericia bacterium]
MHKKHWIGFIIACLFSIVGIVYLWNQSGQFSFLELHYPWIVVAFLLFLFMWFCDAAALLFILRSHRKHLPLLTLFQLTLSAFFFGAITPFQIGMIPALTSFLSNHNIQVDIALPSLLLKSTLNGILRAIISIGLAFYVKDLFGWHVVSILFGYGTAVFLGYILLLNRSRLAAQVRKKFSQFFYWIGDTIPLWKTSMQTVGDSFITFPKTMDPLLKNTSWMPPTISFILLYWCLLFSLPYPLFRALQLKVPFIDVAMLQAAYYMFQSVLPSPGGSGMAEVGLGYVYSLFIGGSSPVFIFLLRLFTFYLPLSFGGIFLFFRIRFPHK